MNTMNTYKKIHMNTSTYSYNVCLVYIEVSVWKDININICVSWGHIMVWIRTKTINLRYSYLHFRYKH